MLRITGLSLLLGFAALIAILTQLYAPPQGAGDSIPLRSWEVPSPETGGTKAYSPQGLKLTKRGSATLALYTPGVDLTGYAFLHLVIDNPPETLATTLKLKRKGAKKNAPSYELPPTSLWLATHELEGWTDNVEAVVLEFQGPPGETLKIMDIALYPATPLRQLKAIYSDLMGNTPWRRANMNTHTGVSKSSSFYPVALAVSLVLLSTFVYCVLLLLFPKWQAFNWKAIGLIVLVCWLGLDLVWQNRLLYQVTHSQRLFAGKTSEEKLAAGPDGRLYRFISKAKEHIDSEDARVFVAARDDYSRMRAAYYFYPLNAYWRLEPPEIPPNEFLLEGDYVVLISPSNTRYEVNEGKGKHMLRGPMNPPRTVERVYHEPIFTLLRIK